MDLILKIAGLLGFFISVATFILTRIERRKKLEIELFHGYESEIEEYDIESHSPEVQIIKIRFTNLGSRPIIVKPATLKIRCNGNVSAVDEYDYWGKDNFEELMPPLSKREIGLHLQSTVKELGIETPEKYDDVTFNKTYPLIVTVQDHENKTFKSSKFSYHESVGEFIT